MCKRDLFVRLNPKLGDLKKVKIDCKQKTEAYSLIMRALGTRWLRHSGERTLGENWQQQATEVSELEETGLFFSNLNFGVFGQN